MTESTQEALRHFKPSRLKDWDVRCFTAMADLPRGDRMALMMVLIAAMGSKAGPLRAPRFGDNAIIKMDRTIWSRYTNKNNATTVEGVQIMTVDQLNHLLGWLVNAIDATDDEYKALVNTVNAWISRDETQLGLHVEKQVEGLKQTGPTDISEFTDDIAAADERKKRAATLVKE